MLCLLFYVYVFEIINDVYNDSVVWKFVYDVSFVFLIVVDIHGCDIIKFEYAYVGC